MKPIQINNRKIGGGAEPYLIAEVGINHSGELAQAKKLILAAAKAGADSVKLQCYRSEDFLAPSSEYFHILKDAELSAEAMTELMGFAEAEGVTLFASVFDEGSAALMASLNAPAFKVASGDLTHLPLLAEIARYGKPMIVSTGGASISDVDQAVAVIRASNPETEIALLHCVSNYPTKPEDTNLACLGLMKEQFGVPVGFSDHTLGEATAVAAVALGAELIEKHFTLDRGADGPDHTLSSDPSGMAVLAGAMKTAWQCVGAPAKKPVEDPTSVAQIRRSLNARMAIPAGTRITEDMLSVRRPGTGIAPVDGSRVIGRVADQDITEGMTITWDMLG